MGSRLEQKSTAVRKRIQSHTFDDEDGEEYNASAFGGFSDYFRRKKIKLQNLDHELRSQAADKPQIFRGIVVHVNGYTQPSLNDLHKLIVQHGGGFLQYLDGKTMVTHIVASNLTPKKAVEFRRYRIVKPAWVVESVKAGKLLPWDEFRLLNEGAGQRVLGFDHGQVVSQVDTRARGYRDQTETSWYTDRLREEPKPQLSSSRATTEDQEDIKLGRNDNATCPPTSSKREGRPSNLESELGRESSLSPPPRSTPQLLRDLRDLKDFEDFQNEIGREDRSNNISFGRYEDEGHGDVQFHPQENKDKSSERVVVAPEDEGIARLTESAVSEAPTAHVEQQDSKTTLDSVSEINPNRAKMTAEEHNAALLADPRIRKSTVVNPEFLEQYYRESRLHHLSTWKAELKAQMQGMAEAKIPANKARQKRVIGARRYILHVDFDSFFAAVSLKNYPQYKDMPVVVAHGNGTGSEIASCNYPARKFGIQNGMWMRRAQELCPQVKILPYDFPGYEEASKAFYEAIIAVGGVVQSVSIDEALVDISDLCYEGSGADGVKRNEGSVYQEQNKADTIAQALRDRVREKTGCEVSVGIGGNILLAKIALRKAKPAGQFHLRPEQILDVIGNLEVEDLPGVAWSIGGKLEEIGIKYVKDIREFSREKLVNTLGPKTGKKLWEYSRGIDQKEVGDVEVRKSVSAEVNWGVRFVTQEQVDDFIENLCGELHKRLVKERVKGRQLSLKLMRRAADAPLDPPKHLGHGKCDTYNKSVLLGVATNSQDVLARETLSMLKAFGFSPGELRGIGVQMQKLEPLKDGPERKLESSQRRLQFKTDSVKKNAEQGYQGKDKLPDDPIEEAVVTPRKQKPTEKIHFGADQLNDRTPSRKPLNTLGTQFLLPTQVDPQVLAELPADIRDKLTKHIRASNPHTLPLDAEVNATTHLAAVSKTFLPNQSQLDPEILNALPEDVRSEILAFYQGLPTKSKAGDQSLLPQSPHKNRTLPAKRPEPASIKRRGRGGGLFGTRSSTSNSTLTQANFIANKVIRERSRTPTTDTEGDDPGTTSAVDHEPETIDEEFLQALPEDIRREVLADQRRLRMQRKSSLNVAAPPRRKEPVPRAEDTEAAPSIQRFLRLPPLPPKPTFTMAKLSALPDLRDAMRDWVREFEDDGPYREDIDALCKYLARVIHDEGDMSKAVAVVKWLAWLVEEEMTSSSQRGRRMWRDAVGSVRDAAQNAVRGKRLGPLNL